MFVRTLVGAWHAWTLLVVVSLVWGAPRGAPAAESSGKPAGASRKDARRTKSEPASDHAANANPVDNQRSGSNDGAATKNGGTIPSKNLLQILRAGGPLMLPLGGCSFVMLVFVLERCLALRRGRVIPAPFVKRLVHQLGQRQLTQEQALELCGQSNSVVAEVFTAGLKKWNKPTVEVEQALQDAGQRAVQHLRRHVRLFNGIATVSPLLGLLGTVFGMIHAFNEIASSSAMGRPEQLAGGISEALITTAAGLVVAIPALTGYMLFVGRVDQLTIEIDAASQQLAGTISSEALAVAPAKLARTPRREAA